MHNINEFPKTYAFIKSLVSIEIASISAMSITQMHNLTSFILKDSDRCYSTVMSSCVIKQLTTDLASAFGRPGLVYDLQLNLCKETFRLYRLLINSLIDSAVNELA